MLFVAYIAFAVGVLASWRSGLLQARPRPWMTAVQLLLSGLLVAVGTAIYLESDEERAAVLIAVLIFFGGVMYATAIALRDSSAERWMRLAAAILVTVGSAFPSLLTLALPLVCALYWGAGQRSWGPRPLPQ